MALRVDVITIFPELIERYCGASILGRAVDAELLDVRTLDPRDATTDVHRTVDAAPFGGGAGMVMKPEPLAAAIERAKADANTASRALLMSPQGRPLKQADLHRWAGMEHLILIAGRYEGFDERVRALVDEEVSLGDFVLTGGEYAALTIIDGVLRLRPGTLGNQNSWAEDSFSHGLLEHPQYTRPLQFQGRSVPEVLKQGNHEHVRIWRLEAALQKTLSRRPDLLQERGFDAMEQRALISAARSSRRPRVHLAVCVERVEQLEPLFRLALAYELVAVHLCARTLERAVLEDAIGRTPAIEAELPYSSKERKKMRRKRRAPERWRVEAKELLRVTDEAKLEGAPKTQIFLQAQNEAPPQRALGLEALRRLAQTQEVCLCLGIQDPKAEGPVFPLIRSSAGARRLPLLAAAAVALDRVFGEG